MYFFLMYNSTISLIVLLYTKKKYILLILFL